MSIPDEVEPIDVVQAIATEGLPHLDDHADQYFAADHDDEEDDHDFVPAFSLFDTLRQHEALVETAPKDNDAVAQIVFCRDDFVVAIRHLLSSESYTLPGGTVLEHESAGRLRARLVAGVMAEVRRRGEAEPVDMIDGTGGATTISLDTHTSVSLGLSERDSVLIQFVPSASVPRNSLGPPRPDRQGIAIAIAAVGVHIAVFLVLGLTPAASTAATEINQGRFAMIEMKDPLLDVPKEKPKPKPKKIEKIKEKQKPELKPPPIPPPPTPQLPESLRKFVTRQPRSQVTLNPKASATANKLLSALGPMNAPSATSQAMTNLNAVPSAEGATGGYKVSGAVGRMGDGLHLAPAGSGTGRVETHGGSEFGKAGKVVATTNGNVRAKITKAPPREVEVQGELDRGEIQKVVNSHLGEISGCYERRLVHNSTLAGKITLEWIIAPTGGVSLVKVKFSSVKDPLVSTCMQTAVRLWKFPQPKGGSVTVTYPFVLGATSM